MGRHLESSHFHETEPSCRAVRRIELIDAKLSPVRVAGYIHEKIAKNSIDQPRRDLIAARLIQNLESKLQFIYCVGTSFVDARSLACRADESSRKKIRQRRMVQPISNETPE